jgi:hypothetical protein
LHHNRPSDRGRVLGRPVCRTARTIGVDVLAEPGRWNDAAVLDAEPSAPVRAHDFADVRHRLAAVLRRSRDPPVGHRKFAPSGAIADDRRELVGEDSREGGKVTGPVMGGAEESADRRLTLRLRVKVAHPTAQRSSSAFDRSPILVRPALRLLEALGAKLPDLSP